MTQFSLELTALFVISLSCGMLMGKLQLMAKGY